MASTNQLGGKTVVVTGCSSGIGIETVRTLSRMGARIIMANRSADKTEPIRQDIISTTGNSNIVFMKLDLASLQSVRDFAQKFNSSESRLDILINNAGIWTKDRQQTVDGFEMMFGTNHLGHFLLTHLLLDKIKASAPSRIVNVSSSMHKEKLDFDDIQSLKNFNDLNVYGKSKAANVMFSTHLAKVLKGTGVTVYSLHPGIIHSGLFRDRLSDGSPIWCCFSMVAACCFCDPMKSQEEGSATTVYCATDPTIANETGQFYENTKKSEAKSHTTDPERAERLWNLSKEMCGIK